MLPTSHIRGCFRSISVSTASQPLWRNIVKDANKFDQNPAGHRIHARRVKKIRIYVASYVSCASVIFLISDRGNSIRIK